MLRIQLVDQCVPAKVRSPVDETYIRVKGKWCYLYRGIDEDGNLVNVRLSEKRHMEAAKAFFAQAQEMVEQQPERVVTDGHTSYPE